MAFAIGGGDASPFDRYPASKASVEGEAPSGFAGGGGDASPFDKRKGSAMFIGRFRHNIDSKGRVSIPVKFREALQGQFEECLIVTSDFDGCLAAYPKEEWQIIAEKAKSLPMMHREVKDFMRFFYSGAVECPLDSQGRILVPPELREYARFNKEVILIGMYNKIEIWDIARWREKEKTASKNLDKIGETLASLGL